MTNPQPISCDSCRDRLEEFALDELEGDERDQVARHIANCSECNRQLIQITADLAALVHTLPEEIPPQQIEIDLLRRIATRPAAEAMRASSEPDTSLNRASWRSLSRRLIAAAIALAACLVGLAAWSTWRSQPVGAGLDQWVELRRRVDDAEKSQRFNAVPTLNFASQRGPAPEKPIHGYIVTDSVMNQWHIYVFNLPTLPVDRTYQLWFTTASSELLPATIAEVDSEGMLSAVVDVPSAPIHIAGLAISDEPQAGTQTPTGEHIYQAKLP